MIAFAEEAIARDAAKTEVRFRGNEVRFGMLSFMGWDGAERTVVMGLNSDQPSISSEGNRLTFTSSQSAEPICKMMKKTSERKFHGMKSCDHPKSDPLYTVGTGACTETDAGKI